MAGFVGVDLSRTSPVGAARAVTWLARALDDAGAYAAVVHGPAGPPDEAGRGVDGRRGHRRRAAGDGAVDGQRGDATCRSAPSADPCAYRTATG